MYTWSLEQPGGKSFDVIYLQEKHNTTMEEGHQGDGILNNNQQVQNHITRGLQSKEHNSYNDRRPS